jgi:sugar fermentation stimulation protein A
MEPYKLYPVFETALFLKRENRFVMSLSKGNQIIKAYIANPGRMEEFQFPGHPFFITPDNQGKYYYRVVSTFYQNSFILLDSIKVNKVVSLLLSKNKIDEFSRVCSIKREFSIKGSKFDFFLYEEPDKNILLEIKSCSLCHSGTAMFPDAPTQRGKRHLLDLEELSNENFQTYNLYLITNYNAKRFAPNLHTDLEYCIVFKNSRHLRFLAYRIHMIDPITIDLNSLIKVPVQKELLLPHCQDKGSYVLVLHNISPFRKKIGKIGEKLFKKGYYVYIGSALNSLKKRINRHLKKNKKEHWHIDYILPFLMVIEKTYIIRRSDKIEEQLAFKMSSISQGNVPGFGSSDSHAPSHLFYFEQNPINQKSFFEVILDFRMFIQ